MRLDLLIYYLFGIGAYWAWSGALLVAAALWPNAGATYTQSIWLTNVSAHCIALAVYGIATPRMRASFDRPLIPWAAASLTVIGTCLLLIGYAQAAASVVPYVGSVISACGTSLALLMWGDALSSIRNDDRMRLILYGSIVVGLLIILLIVCLPDIASTLFCLCLPLAMIFCIARARKNSEANLEITDFSEDRLTIADEEDPFSSLDDHPSSRLKGIVAQIILCCVVLALPAGFYQNNSAQTVQGTEIVTWSSVYSCVCILVGIAGVVDYLFMTRRGTNVFSRLVAPLIAGGLIMFAIFAKQTDIWAGVFMLTGYHLFLVYIYTEYGILSSDMNVDPLYAFAFGTCAIDIGLIIGYVFHGLLSRLPDEWSLGAISVAVYLLLLIGILIFPKVLEDVKNRRRDKETLAALYSFNGNALSDDVEKSNFFEADVEHRCTLMSRHLALSEREGEVMSYLLKGRSLRSIATEMFLSYNTVKTHVSHIYRKANVHTRDELIDTYDKFFHTESVRQEPAG